MNYLKQRFNHKIKQYQQQHNQAQALRNDQSPYNQFQFENIFKNVDYQKQAKDRFENLHPNYTQPIRKGFQAIQDYIQLHENDILNTVRQIDMLCIKTAQRNIQNYNKCKLLTDQRIHKEIFVPLVNSSALLYKISNQCLLKGNNIDMCGNLVADHCNFMFKTAVQRIKNMAQPLRKLVPEQFQAPQPPMIPLNNQIKD